MADRDGAQRLFEALPIGVIHHKHGTVRHETRRAALLLPAGGAGHGVADRLGSEDAVRFERQLDELLDGRREVCQIIAWPRFRSSDEALVLTSRLADIDGDASIMTTVEPFTAGSPIRFDGTLRAFPALVHRIAGVIDEAVEQTRGRIDRGRQLAADQTLQEILGELESQAVDLAALARLLDGYAEIGGDQPEPDLVPLTAEALLRRLIDAAEGMEIQTPGEDGGDSATFRVDRARIDDILGHLVYALRRVSTSGAMMVSWRADDNQPTRRVLRLATDTLGLSDVSWHLPLLQVSGGPGGSATVTLRVALGVDLAARWIAAMEGELALFMDHKRRAVIDLSLPTVQRDQAATEAAAPEQRDSAARGLDEPTSILIVEDNAISRDLAVITARRRGYRVTSAVDGIDALERMADGPFDLVLMDLQMPRMDGWEACREIRARWPRQRVLAVSAKTDPEIAKSVQEAFDGFLVKPINWHVVGEILNQSAEPIA
ncbi:MAG: response regulator [Azospirillaceae bacterium]